jgi:penicillin-binding protein 1C
MRRAVALAMSGPAMKRALLVTAALVALAAVAIAGARAVWREPFRAIVPTSVAITDANGKLLRLTLASDDKYRLWTPLAHMPPELIEAVLLKEDQWFRWHPGVNPVALARGGWRTYVEGDRQGGSTLTMQLARARGPLNTRSIGGKVRQVAHALALEALYSKDEILEAYLNLVPYGQNVEGVGAASLIYFSRPARELTTPEILTLAVIPQSPKRRSLATAGQGDLVNAETDGLAKAREALFHEWVQRHPDAARFSEFISAPLKLRALRELPFAAPHLTTQLLGQRRDDPRPEIATLLDLRLQRTLERQVRQHVAREGSVGIRNAAAMLIDTRDMGVKALVGSADFFDAAIDGQVNGALARRSPGSALKPFIYALALDQGLIHPGTVLRDAPTSFGPFSPENFDGQFAGPIAARDALVRSRNVPAVALAANLASPSLHQFLKSAGVARLRSERHYGLALALGGGEITMEELATLYAMLANNGTWKALRYRADEPVAAGVRLLSEEAAFVTLDMLRDNPRPESSLAERGAARRIAWKTGTSWGFRDAWTAGVVGPYVLVVWIGNFDGEGNPAFVGVRAAAPLFFRIADALAAEGRLAVDVSLRQPMGLARIEVCAASGDLPNAWCPKRETTWFIPGKSPIRVSTLHRAVAIDPRTGRVACTPEEARRAKLEVYEYWPSDMQRLFLQAGLPRRAPPPADCAAASDPAGSRPRIQSPLTGTSYVLRLNDPKPPEIALAAALDASARELHWFAGESYLGSSAGNTTLAWNPATAGRYLIRAIDDHGRSDSREVRVEAEK